MTDTPKTAAPCMFCGRTDDTKMRTVCGMDIYRVAACDLCVEFVKADNHDIRRTWVLTAYGATHTMNRIEVLEAAAKTMRANVAGHEQQIGKLEERFPDDPEDAKDCDGEFVDLPNPHEEIRKQRDALHREVQQLKHVNEQLMDVLETRTTSNRDHIRKLNAWRFAPRIQIGAIGRAHDGLYAKVPEGER